MDFAQLSSHLGGQKHLLRFWEDLSEEQRLRFSNQLCSLDTTACASAFSSSAEVCVPSACDLSPVPSSHVLVTSSLTADVHGHLSAKGLECISKGELAVLVLAGGQATRLGSKDPKGTIPLGLGLSVGDSLLGLQATRIRRLEKLAEEKFPGVKAVIPWLVMTSDATEAATRSHLKTIVEGAELTDDQVTVFSQGNIPAFDMEGHILLATKDGVALSPNGNGGVFSALSAHLPALSSRGVRYVHVYCVDNILVKVGDPCLLGYAVQEEADVVAKVVRRRDEGEKVGVICLEKGRPRVVEYTELGELAARRGADGELQFNAGNIANHLFAVDFLNKVVMPKLQLPYHRAVKKIPYVDENGSLVKPDEPNGIKLEQFVFDVFGQSERFRIMEVNRDEEFSPLKNAEVVGTECLSTCARDISRLHASWLRRVGAKVEEPVRIAAARSYDGEGLEEYAGQAVSGLLV